MKAASTVCSIAFVAVFATGSMFAVTVEINDACEGMGTVAWSQKGETDGRVALTLKATAADGCSFAGWSASGVEDDWRQDARLDSLSGVLVPTGASVMASFVRKADDVLAFDVANLFEELPCGEPFEEKLEIDSFSFPTLTVAGLPTGLSFDKKSLVVSGTPTVPGSYLVEISGRNASGYTFSQFFRAGVGNRSGKRLVGVDDTLVVGEYWHADFSDLFSFDADATNAVALSASVPGLSWNASWGLLYGTPTKPGVFLVRGTVAFKDGTRETATARLTIAHPDPAKYDVDLDDLDWVSVGDVFEPDESEIGTYAGGVGIVSVSGLPDGISVETWGEGGVKHFGLSGTACKAGVYTVVVKVAVEEWETRKTIVTAREVIVGDTTSGYLEVGYLDEGQKLRGTISVGGAVSVVSSATVKATAKKGYAFAGWYDEDGAPFAADATDFRNPSLMFSPGDDLMLLTLRARFVSAADDGEVEIVGLDGVEVEFDAADTLDETFSVLSESLPTLTFKGLPAGVSAVPATLGDYRLVYDAESAKKTPAPGRYTVTATAVNASKAKATATFVVTVANIVHAGIHVLTDYGDFVPGEVIEPIDLSGAVDFANGETLSVSGLPKGLTFNAKANAKKGIAANTITGAPTTPGYSTVTFSAKVVSGATTNKSGKVTLSYASAKATAFMRVLPYPELSVDLDDEAAAAGCKVTGGGNYASGTKVTLKATAAKGWVFAGWEGLDQDDALPFANLSPKLSIMTGGDDFYFDAAFVQVCDDRLEIAEPDETENGFAAEFVVGVESSKSKYATLLAELIDTVSYPTVSVAGLPPGLKFGDSTFRFSGKPTKAGVYWVTAMAKNAGGYTFTRVLKVAVLNKDGSVPSDEALPNAAGIDFSPINGVFTTGDYLVDGAVRLNIGAHPKTGAAVKKVSVSGIPAGLSASAFYEGGAGVVALAGMPTKPGRFEIAVKVSYADGKSAKSQYAVVVADGGSHYLLVKSENDSLGTASGSGVYAAGAKVKVSAKATEGCVFAGWLDDTHGYPFSPMMTKYGKDYRTAIISFPLCPDDFHGDCSIYAAFVTKKGDKSVRMAVESDFWTFATGRPSIFPFDVLSASLPKVSAKGLPKGVSVDLVNRVLSYDGKSAMPGIYEILLTAKNLSGAVATTNIEVWIENLRSDAIGGLNPNMDAYQLKTGVSLDPKLIMPVVEDGWTLAVKGLPAGLSYKNGIFAGVPTKVGDYTVIITATTGSGKAKRTETATITMRVEALPAWAFGQFNGIVESGGLVQSFAVGTTGKVSGKILSDDGTWTFSAKSIEAYDDNRGTFAATVIGKNGKKSLTNVVEIAAEVMSGGMLRGVATSKDGDWVAWQNIWKLQPWKTMAKSFAKSRALTLYLVADEAEGCVVLDTPPDDGSPYDTLALKFASSGDVTASGKFTTGYNEKTKKAIVYSSTCSSVLIPCDKDDETVCFAACLHFSSKTGSFNGCSLEILLEWDGGEFLLAE